jgi:hypothetical protein
VADFDPETAAREILAGLHEARKCIQLEERQAVTDLAVAEAKMNAMSKIRGALDIVIAERQSDLDRIVEKKKRAERSPQ